jgi:hypothetical protein
MIIKGFGKTYWSLVAVQAYASAISILRLCVKSQYHKFHYKCLPPVNAPPFVIINH